MDFVLVLIVGMVLGGGLHRTIVLKQRARREASVRHRIQTAVNAQLVDRALDIVGYLNAGYTLQVDEVAKRIVIGETAGGHFIPLVSIERDGVWQYDLNTFQKFPFPVHTLHE